MRKIAVLTSIFFLFFGFLLVSPKQIFADTVVSLSGHVYDSLGNPVSAQEVMLYSNGQEQDVMSTDSTGYYIVHVNPGVFTLEIGNFSNNLNQNIAQNDLFIAYSYSLTQDTVADFTLPFKKVAVHVQDTIGNPISNVAISTTPDSNVASTLLFNLGSGIQTQGGFSSYGYNVGTTHELGPQTDSSGNVNLWLLQNDEFSDYNFLAQPQVGTAFNQANLPHIILTADQNSEIITLPFSHPAPGTILQLSPNPNSQNQYQNPTTVTLSPTATAGFTIANTYYTIDGGTQQTYSTPFTISNSGNHTLTYWSVDNAGVIETVNSQSFTIYANQPPVVTSVTAPVDPQPITSSIAAVATFNDPDLTDRHTAVWNWGDGTTSVGTITEASGSGTVSNPHLYAQAGVYTIGITVTDNAGATATNQYQYVVIYDPAAGFVTGSGTFDTPVGTYINLPSFSGKTHFGFNAKYKKDGSLDGKTKTDWKPASTDIDLDSLGYQWLVVNGNKAQFKGTGQIMDQGSYTFLITVLDGGSSSPDKLRMKITNNANNGVVYDTQMGADDSADPTMIISKGQIKIHN